MGCYVIVTCHSMLWTLLTVATTLGALYCITSTNWLIGYERPYGGFRPALVTNHTTTTVDSDSESGGYKQGVQPQENVPVVDMEGDSGYNMQKQFKTPMYSPSVG